MDQSYVSNILKKLIWQRLFFQQIYKDVPLQIYPLPQAAKINTVDSLELFRTENNKLGKI